jgi:uncharacterized membrane protein
MPDRVSAPAKENIRAVSELERSAEKGAAASERISIAISRFVGSMPFVAGHLAFFCAWAIWNATASPYWRFDPYPWGLLTFLVAVESLFIAIFVLIAQNRMSRQSDERDHLNLQIDLLTEQEMTIVLRLLRKIADRLQVEPDPEDARQVDGLTQRTDIKNLVEALRRRQ